MDIPIKSLVLFFLFFVPIIIANRIIKLRVSKELYVSLFRMILQLTLVGLYLKYIFEWNNPYINMAYLIVMIVIASMHSIRSSRLKLKTFIIPILISVAIPQIIVIFSFNILVGGIERIFDANLIIPVGGMLLGNCLNGNIIAINSFYQGIAKDEKRYNYTMTLGASHFQAILPYLRTSMELSIKPSLASMATTGLVTLPGMMTGQILAGTLPVTAVKYQAAILVSILTAKYFSTLLSLLLSKNKGFTNYLTLDRTVLTI